MTSGMHASVTLKGHSPPSCTGTMVQDFLHGRTATINFINAAMSATGSRHRIPAPYHAFLAGFFKFREYPAVREDGP